MDQYLSPKGLGQSLAILSAVFMLLLSIGVWTGYYQGAAEAMQQWHMFYSFSAVGTIAGMIEGAVHGYVMGYALAWLYNKAT
jgi:hypothetical protein